MLRKTLTHTSIASSSCMCMWKIYVQYTDIVYWKSCVEILCYVLWRIVCPGPESPNNKTIITLEPIEIPFSFRLRCWSIWRGILTRKNRDHRFGWGAGAQGQRAPQTITFWITVSEWFYFTRFERSRFYEHFDTKISQIGPLQPVIWPLEDCGSTGGAQILGGPKMGPDGLPGLKIDT